MIFSKIKKLFSSKKEYEVNRIIRVHNINTAKKIGILYEATANKQIQEIKKLVEFFFHDNRKKVKSLGYVKGKKLDTFHFPKLNYDFFISKDLSWKPSSENYIIKNFLENEFDILINVCDSSIDELTYIARMSVAHFKIGRYQEGQKVYDFMIDVKKDNVKQFINEVMKYIKIINT